MVGFCGVARWGRRAVVGVTFLKLVIIIITFTAMTTIVHHCEHYPSSGILMICNGANNNSTGYVRNNNGFM